MPDLSSALAPLLAILVAAVAARVAWAALRPTFASPAFARTNVRGSAVPVGAGVALVGGALGAAVVGAALERAGLVDVPASVRGAAVASVVAVLGLALVGLLDDLAGGADSRGFRGHLGALAGGTLTTGGAKVVGGALVALVAVAAGRSVARDIGSLASLGMVVVDGAAVALWANVGNLFDRAPGRAVKVVSIAWLAVAAAAVASVGSRAGALLVPTAAIVGGALGLLREDLRERLMLGDTGANPLGAAVGLAAVATLPGWGRAVALAVALALNAGAEVISFSRAIDAAPPLRALDRLGRLP